MKRKSRKSKRKKSVKPHKPPFFRVSVTQQEFVKGLLGGIRDYNDVPVDMLAKLYVMLRVELGRLQRSRGYLEDPKQYKRTGECNRCGLCCNPLTLYGMLSDPVKGRCKNLTWKWRKGKRLFRCKSYEDRPVWCRHFPNHPSDIEYIPDCSYKFVEVKP